MDLNKFTEKAQQALAGSQKLAARMNHQQIDVEHVLLALLDQERGWPPAILDQGRACPSTRSPSRLQRELEKLPRVTGPSGPPRTSTPPAGSTSWSAHAEDEAKKLKDEYVSVEHLLLALTDDKRRRPARRSRSSASPATGC